MKTHGEVQAAIDAGEQLQVQRATEPTEWLDIDAERATSVGPHFLRIKPKKPERLECYSHLASINLGHVFMMPGPGDVLLREVRPGDMTREQIDTKLEVMEKVLTSPSGMIEYDEVRHLLTEGREDG